MESIAASSGTTALVRPVIALQGDLTAVLREGRVVSGEVMQSLDGGSILVGIGEHRVPVQSQVRLPLGQRLLFVVERRGGELVLRLLPGEAGALDPLVRATRGLLGSEVSAGRLLGQLRELLAAPPGVGGPEVGAAPGAPPSGRTSSADPGSRTTSPGSELAGGPVGAPGEPSAGTAAAVDPAVLAKLAEQLERLAFRPGADGAALREAIGGSGETFRLATLAALFSLFDAEGGAPGRAAADLARGLSAAVAHQAAGASEEGILAALRTLVEPALRTLLREPGLARLVEEGGFEALVRGFARELVRAARSLGGPIGERLASALAGLDPAALMRGRQPALLAALLAAARGGGETEQLVRAVLAELAGPARDLSGSLLSGLLELPDGNVREATVRSLAGIELENLLNLARREFGEASHWSFPLPDGGAWTTAHLFARVGDEGRGGGTAGEDEAFRLTLGVEFTHLGPIRGDLVFRGSRLALRLRVARADVAERLRADLGRLREELATGDGSVMLSVVLASPTEAGVDELLRDIRFLREHHVMDVRG